MKRIFSLVVLGIVLCMPVLATDLTQYEIVQSLIPASGQDSEPSYMNELKLPFLRETVPLARSQVLREDNGREVSIGFCPDTLKLEWVVPSQVLWVHWATYSQGTGGFNFDGNLLLDIRYGSYRELFRDFFMSYAHGGWWHSQSAELKFSFDRSLNVLRLEFERVDFYTEEEKPLCYSDLKVDSSSDPEKYEFSWREREIRTYQIQAGRLVYLSGYTLALLDPRGISLKRLAGHLETSEAALKGMNPQLKSRKVWKDWVMTNRELPPYKNNVTNDGLTGGF